MRAREPEAATGREGCSEAAPLLVVEGIGLFNQREFFRCHQVLEGAWRQEERPVRQLYQSILIVAAAFHHMQRDNYRGATVLLERGIDMLQRLRPRCQGVDVDGLIEGCGRCLAEVRRLGPAGLHNIDRGLIPQISLGLDHS